MVVLVLFVVSFGFVIVVLFGIILVLFCDFVVD